MLLAVCKSGPKDRARIRQNLTGFSRCRVRIRLQPLETDRKIRQVKLGRLTPRVLRAEGSMHPVDEAVDYCSTGHRAPPKSIIC